ncbi:MAG: GlcNAc-PI de-N-acetylase [Oscillochloris sp.]|nr:GlcNAc-PI de-N-acetylase [Oscillochloris sp.]
MIYQNLTDLPTDYTHIYLSPHLDDAALSCGGMIAAQCAAAERVLVVTLCTAAPPANATFSNLALSFHREWGLDPEQVVAARLEEDSAAISILGADSFWAGMLDAIYRHPGAYHSRETLFAAPAPDDPLVSLLHDLINRLGRYLPGAHFYAPLGIGDHVDHQITYSTALACAGRQLAFYEDAPYVMRPGLRAQRLAQLGLELQPQIRQIGATLEQKIASVRAYASQMAELAASQLGRQATPAEAVELMATTLRTYALEVDVASGGAERLWVQVG